MNNGKKVAARWAAVLISSMMIAAVCTVTGAAAADSPSTQNGQASARAAAGVRVTVNGSPYDGTAFIQNSITYVGIREFSMSMGASSVSWNSDAKTAIVVSDNLNISAKYSNLYITANGRYLWTSDGVKIINGTMFVPLRTIAKAFDCTVGWDQKSMTASVTTGNGYIKSGDSYYDGDCVLWLARIIHAEAVGEPLAGKVAVGSVVLNRVNSPSYPNTIYSVIFDKKNGVQFTPAANKTVYNTPGEDSVIAAKLCLDGARVSDSVLFFVNEAIAENTWVSDNRTYVMTVGNHKFFA